jgi:hypothetical protein
MWASRPDVDQVTLGRGNQQPDEHRGSESQVDTIEQALQTHAVGHEVSLTPPAAEGSIPRYAPATVARPQHSPEREARDPFDYKQGDDADL